MLAGHSPTSVIPQYPNTASENENLRSNWTQIGRNLKSHNTSNALWLVFEVQVCIRKTEHELIKTVTNRFSASLRLRR